jgi:hypothetical protein
MFYEAAKPVAAMWDLVRTSMSVLDATISVILKPRATASHGL